jgi:Mg/Co/Ni transporter MgtE
MNVEFIIGLIVGLVFYAAIVAFTIWLSNEWPD